MRKCNLLILFLMGLLLSCTTGFFEQINEEEKLPAAGEPVVRSFARENAIVIEWQADEGADAYLLYRDTHPGGSFNHLVYQGQELKYIDEEIKDEIFYYYKLAKQKGSREFEKSEAVFGMSSCTRCDRYEKNDALESARDLDNITYANLHYYADGRGNQLLDRDWYRVTVPARKYLRLKFEIEQSDIYLKGQLRFNRSGGPLIDIFHLQDNIELRNGDYQEATLYFQISANKMLMHNQAIVYTIKKDLIDNIAD